MIVPRQLQEEAVYCPSELITKEIHESISSSLNELDSFSLLSSSFNKDIGLPKHEIQNFYFDQLRLSNNHQFKSSLKNIDNLLKLKQFDINDLKSRIISDDFNDNYSSYTELMLSDKLSKKIGIDNIELYPKIEPNNELDIKIHHNDSDVLIEVGNRMKNTPEKIITEIYESSIKRIYELLQEELYVNIVINVKNLTRNENKIIKNTSVENICVEFMNLYKDNKGNTMVNGNKFINYYVQKKHIYKKITMRGINLGYEDSSKNWSTGLWRHKNDALLKGIINHIRDDCDQIRNAHPNMVIMVFPYHFGFKLGFRDIKTGINNFLHNNPDVDCISLTDDLTNFHHFNNPDSDHKISTAIFRDLFHV